ncbi:MAG: hypothetical protein OHK0023_01560 [Anaerolineae bacterium]
MITVRLATLQDTSAITAVHTSDIAEWGRLLPNGEVQPADYNDLTIYERWQHGGPWLSLETCALHLNRLLAGAGFPLVACAGDQVLAEAEVYESIEPAPFGHQLEISVINTHADHQRSGFGSALMDYIIQMARLMRCERITISDADLPEFYEKFGFRHVRDGRGVRFSAQSGRVVYQATELTNRDAAQIKGWHMPLGRYRSSRQEWQKLFPQEWAAGIPELLDRTALHVKLSVSGVTNAILFVSEPEIPHAQVGDLHIACWSERPPNAVLIAAIRDWAFRQGFKNLMSYVMDDDLPLLGNDVQSTGYTQSYYELIL